MGTFDFSIPYKMYLRKGEGKAAGMKRLDRTITTQEEYDSFCEATQNYVDLCKKEGRERRYIMMWSTFCNNWEDFSDRQELGLSSRAAQVITMPLKLKR